MALAAKMIDRNTAVLRERVQRRSPSLPETLLWRALRDRPVGLKFRRQHPLGHFVADFYCAAAKLVIEIYGESHRMGGRPQRDERRDEWLRGQGLRVVRFGASEVMTDVASVITAIVLACRR